MSTFVLKLGSSIVADDSGEVRGDVLARVCAVAAARHGAGDEIVIVTSGAIAYGIRQRGLPLRPEVSPYRSTLARALSGSLDVLSSALRRKAG